MLLFFTNAIGATSFVTYNCKCLPKMNYFLARKNPFEKICLKMNVHYRTHCTQCPWGGGGDVRKFPAKINIADPLVHFEEDSH
jgi:hypothetical protein